MERPSIPKDDLLDVMEMTQKLETAMSKILKENDHLLGTSALMSATVNYLLSQCITVKQFLSYRNMFIEIFNLSLENMTLNNEEK